MERTFKETKKLNYRLLFMVLFLTLSCLLSVSALAAEGDDGGARVLYINQEDTPQTPIVEEASVSISLMGADSSAWSERYGYTSLGTMENGAALQAFYEAIGTAAHTFHTDFTIDVQPDLAVATIGFAELGLTEEQAISVWLTFKYDNPIYYWLSNTVMVNPEYIVLLTDEDYSSGVDRQGYLALIEAKTAEFLAITEGETSAYQIAMAFHDAIIEQVDYAYEDDGITPENELWAHSILGVMEKGAAVCESYAKTFQLLLDASGVENIFVTGVSNDQDHAWNLVKMDDGAWYWFDLTWDDQPGRMWGVAYNYFAVNDTENINWFDGEYEYGAHSDFLDGHSINLPGGTGVDFLYELPKRAEQPFAAEDLILRDTFTVGGMTYAVAGYNNVMLSDVSTAEQEVIIPETITYEGRTYTVMSIGGISPYSKQFVSGPEWKTSVPISVTIPKTVRFILDRCFYYNDVGIAYFNEIRVDPENETFCSVDGVLFTKSKYTLIAYPNASSRTSYVIPDETVYIANGAFNSCINLETLTIGKNVENAGVYNWGDGFPNEKVFIVTIDSGGFVRLYEALCGEKNLLVHPDNQYYRVENDVLYTANYVQILAVLGTDMTEFTIRAETGALNKPSTSTGAFYNCKNLRAFSVEEGNPYFCAIDGVLYNIDQTQIVEVPMGISGDVVLPDTLIGLSDSPFRDRVFLESVTLPEKMETIAGWAFYGCTNLKQVQFSSNLVTIENSAFYGCTSLETAILPDGLTELGSNAFCSCTKLKEVVLPESLITIGESVFYDCSIEKIIIPSKVTSIDYGVFYNCSNLKDVILPENLAKIGRNAFYNCAIQQITIPASVTTIGYGAFNSSDSLLADSMEVFFAGNAPSSMYEKGMESGSFIDNTVVYYQEGASGWTDSEYYNAEEQTWKGYVLKQHPYHDPSQYIYSKVDEDTHTKSCECGFNVLEKHSISSETGNCVCGGLCVHENVVATPNQDGVTHTVECQSCKTIITASAVHVGGLATCTTQATCIECGQPYGSFAKHMSSLVAGYAATCTEDGRLDYYICTECGKFFSDSACENEIAKDAWIIQASHVLVQVEAKAATCTEVGWHAYEYCTRCGDYNTKVEIPSTGHAYTGVVSEPTCTEQGYTTHTCHVCGDSYVGDYTAAWGHSWNAWAEMTDGSWKRTCMVVTCTAAETVSFEDTSLNTTQPADNALGANLSSDNIELFHTVLSEDEKAQMAAGTDVRIYLSVEDVSETVDSAEKALVESVAGKSQIALYLDIDLFKKVGSTEAKPITDIDGELSITIQIPEELRNTYQVMQRTYHLIRIHDGVADTIQGNFDAESNSFTFQTDRFSTYALSYTDTPDLRNTNLIMEGTQLTIEIAPGAATEKVDVLVMIASYTSEDRMIGCQIESQITGITEIDLKIVGDRYKVFFLQPETYIPLRDMFLWEL